MTSLIERLRAHFEVDKLAARLRCAARQPQAIPPRHPNDSRSFSAHIGGAVALVQIDHIDGKPTASVQISVRHLNSDAAEALLRFLASRNAPNSSTTIESNM